MTEAVHVRVDGEMCVGTGMCEASAPDLFEVTEDGTARALLDVVPPDRVDAARQAAADCPTRALQLDGS